MTTNQLTTLSRLTFDAPDDQTLDDGVRALVTPRFGFRQEGSCVDVDGFLEHLHGLRAAMTHGEVTLLDELVDRSTEPARLRSGRRRQETGVTGGQR